MNFKDNTYFLIPKDDPRDRVEVEVGDSKDKDKFHPQVKIKRWDNEVNLSVRLKDEGTEPEEISTEADKIKWKKGIKDVSFYELPESEDLKEGGYEFQIDLAEKPASNKVGFTIETKGLDFFYQPEYVLKG